MSERMWVRRMVPMLVMLSVVALWVVAMDAWRVG